MPSDQKATKQTKTSKNEKLEKEDKKEDKKENKKTEKKPEKKVEKKVEKKADKAEKKTDKKTDKKKTKKSEKKETGKSEKRGRSFKAIYVNPEGEVVLEGRYCGAKPKQAACKALTGIYKIFKLANNEVNGAVYFGVKETTRGGKGKHYWYSGERVTLNDPIVLSIQNGKVITYKFNNVVKKASESECENLLSYKVVDKQDEQENSTSEKKESKKKSTKKSDKKSEKNTDKKSAKKEEKKADKKEEKKSDNKSDNTKSKESKKTAKK